jgi:hypothetical protein
MRREVGHPIFGIQIDWQRKWGSAHSRALP